MDRIIENKSLMINFIIFPKDSTRKIFWHLKKKEVILQLLMLVIMDEPLC